MSSNKKSIFTIVGLVAMAAGSFYFFLSPGEKPKIQMPDLKGGSSLQASKFIPFTPEEIQEARSEMKLTLENLLHAQNSFFQDENRYTSDLKVLGWAPLKGEIRYKAGFAEAFHPVPLVSYHEIKENPENFTTDQFIRDIMTDGSQDRYHYSELVTQIDLHVYDSLCRYGCKVTVKTFEIIFVMPLGDLHHVDVWLVNHNNEIVRIKDGVTGQLNL